MENFETKTKKLKLVQQASSLTIILPLSFRKEPLHVFHHAVLSDLQGKCQSTISLLWSPLKTGIIKSTMFLQLFSDIATYCIGTPMILLKY